MDEAPERGSTDSRTDPPVGPVSSRIRIIEAGTPSEKHMRRIRSDPARIRFTGLD